MSEQIPNPDWNKFLAVDPFNSQNEVEGFISHHNSDDYGAILIEKINGISCEQLIYCTPKIRYPFDKENRWTFPKAKAIERFRKYDGTNIFAYSYQDSNGTKFVSYKTRLLPFVQQSKFGPFLEMWKEMLVKYPDIPKFILNSGLNLSFELWGMRNPHLVKYIDVPLEASLLFARKGQIILPPSRIEFANALSTASLNGVVTKDYVWTYQQTQQELEEQLSETEDGYIGDEGEVWYLLDETGKWNLFKLKPATIEAIHWAAGGIGKNVIWATIENSFEQFDIPTVDNIRELLLEEFPKEEIEKVHYSIERQLVEAIKNHEFKLQVLAKYNALGMSILNQKLEVMRALSSKFARGDMKKVFSHIWNSAAK